MVMKTDIKDRIKEWEASGIDMSAMTQEELEDAFETELKFGTAGLRGILGPGTARMNEYVIRRATLGVASYLKAHNQDVSVVISYDSRNRSREFAQETARILLGAGIKTYLFSDMMPVPILSYAVRMLGCTAGIMITASHNPKEYNGYKVYGANGGQILDKQAVEILQSIDKFGYFDSFETGNLDDAICADELVYSSYLKEVQKYANLTSQRELGIIYTPLNGSGSVPVQDVLKQCDFDVVTVEEQCMPDGNFPTCPYPNPENEEVYELAKRYAFDKNADIIIATDPDCDRVGCMVRDTNGYRLLSGNEIGIILTQYLCENIKDISDGVIVSTVVSTTIIDKIAADNGMSVVRTLVGFKYIGEQIDILKKRFVFGFEESNGYLAGDHARDKDGVIGSLLLCQAAAYYKHYGKTLADVLCDIQGKYGPVINRTFSIKISSDAQRNQIMNTVRTKELEGKTDYISGINGLPAADMVQIDCSDGARMIIRPSGTEPKIKLYIFANSEERIAEIETWFRNELMNR